MTIATYAELVEEMEAWLNRADLTDRIPTFIRLFEARFNRNVRVPAMEATSTSTLESGELALPDDFLQARSLHLTTDPITVLQYLAPQKFRQTYAANQAGQPIVFTVEGANLLVGPEPETSYTATLCYFQRLPALTSVATTNWLLDSHPDIYLYGSLCMADAFLRDEEQAAKWKGAWDEAMAELTQEGQRARVVGPLVMRPSASF